MNKKGITLIALVVTIIVLLILSAVSISVLLGDDGIIKKAQDSKLVSRYAQISDLVKVRETSLKISFEKNESGELNDAFINRLKAQGLVKSEPEDLYDEAARTLRLGLQKNGEYKYNIYILDGSLLGKEIIDRINELPDADAPGNEHLKHMTLKIRTTEANEEVNIPISDMTNLTIDWGDGNTTSTDTHTYSQAKEYELKIIGKSNNATFGYDVPWDENPNIVGIIHWGENNFISMYSFGRSLEGEIPIPSRNSFNKSIGFVFTFYGCTGLTGSIPSKLFANCPNVTSFEDTFHECTGLTGSIPSNLFANCPNVTSFNFTFSRCSGLAGSIPADLFDNNTVALFFNDTFDRCTGLTGSIPFNLFANCPNVTDFEFTFYECSGLTGSIPSGLFADNPNVTIFRSTFDKCSGLTGGIPTGLFSNNPNVTSFHSTFSGCSGLTGSIPAGLFSNNPNVTTFHSTFFGCSGLTAIPIDLFDNNANVTTFHSTFGGCSGLTAIPIGLFDNNVKVEDFKFMFSDCSGLTGPAPELWKRPNHPSGYECFYGCTKLSNYSLIPTSWK